jgi:fluoride exporter
MFRLLMIVLGGAAGTAARYGVQYWAREALGQGFPWGTLFVNLLGSFLIGLIMTVGLQSEVMSVTTRMALVTGVMGGFTTYSSFNYETLQLVETRATGLALANVGGTLVGCWIAGALGLLTGRRVLAVLAG